MSKKTSTPDPKPLGTLERDLLEAGYKTLVTDPLNGWFKPVYPGQAGHLKIAGLLEKRDGGEFRLTEKGAEAMGKPYPVPGMKHQPGDGLPVSEPTDDIGTAGPVIKSGDMQITKTRPDGTPEVISFPGGTEGDFAAWIDDQLSKPVIPEPPIQEGDAQPVTAINDERATTLTLDASIGYSKQLERQLTTKNNRIAKLEAENLSLAKECDQANRKLSEEEPKRSEAWAQVDSLKTELATITAERDKFLSALVELEGERNAAHKANEVLAAHTADLQMQLNLALEINRQQSEMLKERVPAAQGNPQHETMWYTDHMDIGSEGEDTDLSALEKVGWTIAFEQFMTRGGGHDTVIYAARLTRPILKPASGDEARETIEELRRQGMFVREVGPQVTIIMPPAQVPEPVQNSLTADIRARGADAVLADMDAYAMTAGDKEYRRVRDWFTSAEFPAFPRLGGGS